MFNLIKKDFICNVKLRKTRFTLILSFKFFIFKLQSNEINCLKVDPVENQKLKRSFILKR